MKITITASYEIECGLLTPFIKAAPQKFVDEFEKGIIDGIREKLPEQMELKDTSISYITQ